MQDSALKRPTARSAESPTTLKSKRGAQGALAQKLNASARVVAQRALAAQLNRGGLPENLRNGVERLSGVSLAGVKVHYNSAKPSQLNAEAYAQGRDIHLAPGKAHHLPHEAWHVAQQAQGRVKPTMQLQEAVPINDDKRLEKEADTMGKKAATIGSVAQRAVPENANLPKPVAVVVGYNPTGDDVAFNKNIFGLDDMDMRPSTRMFVYNRSHPFIVGGVIESVCVATGTQENIKGVQLDHRISWHKMAESMHDRNVDAEKSNKDFAFKKYWYTLKNARLYFNDVTNLQPVLSSDNAAGGAEGVQAPPDTVHEDIKTVVKDTHGAWMLLQRELNRLGANPNQQFGTAAVGEVVDVQTRMNNISGAIETHLNPPVPQFLPTVAGGGDN